MASPGVPDSRDSCLCDSNDSYAAWAADRLPIVADQVTDRTRAILVVPLASLLLSGVFLVMQDTSVGEELGRASLIAGDTDGSIWYDLALACAGFGGAVAMFTVSGTGRRATLVAGSIGSMLSLVWMGFMLQSIDFRFVP